jgi:AcrR family transcriptional regulator
VTRIDRRTRAAREERADARARLLDAAARVFAARGYRGTSIDAVAAEAGYSKGAVYWHFASKADLFFALMDDRVDRTTHEMVALLTTAPADQDMAPEGSRRLGELVRAQREMLLLDHEYWMLAAREPALRRRYAERSARLRSELGRALKVRLRHLGAEADGDPEHMASVVMALTTGLAQQQLIDPDAVPERLLGEAMVLLYRGVAADP